MLSPQNSVFCQVPRGVWVFPLFAQEGCGCLFRKSYLDNFDDPGKFLTNFPASQNAIPAKVKSLLMPLFLMGCFPVDFQEVKRPLRTKSVKHPIKVGKRPINEGKRPIKAKALVGVSVGSLMGCFSAPPPWRKTAPLKRPIKRSMTRLGAPGKLASNSGTLLDFLLRDRHCLLEFF